MRPRPRPRPITVRPRPRPRPKKWSRDHTGLETLTSLRSNAMFFPLKMSFDRTSMYEKHLNERHSICMTSGKQQNPFLAEASPRISLPGKTTLPGPLSPLGSLLYHQMLCFFSINKRLLTGRQFTINILTTGIL